MGNIATMLIPLGAQALQGASKTSQQSPNLASSSLNTSGSSYSLNSNNSSSPLINSTPSTMQWLIIGGIVLGGIFLMNR